MRKVFGNRGAEQLAKASGKRDGAVGRWWLTEPCRRNTEAQPARLRSSPVKLCDI